MYELNKEKNKLSRILKNIEYFQEIESTHTYIKDIADNDLKKSPCPALCKAKGSTDII